MGKKSLVVAFWMGFLSMTTMWAGQKESAEWTMCNSPDYIKWLEQQSMLQNACKLTESMSGSKAQWQHPYALPEPARVVEKASVWFTAYLPAIIGTEGQSIIQLIGDSNLWQILLPKWGESPRPTRLQNRT